MKNDPYGFCYGSCTREFLNIPSVKGKHGHAFSKVFPQYCLTETTVLTFLQGKEKLIFRVLDLYPQKSISPAFLIPDCILSARTSEGMRIRSH